MFRYLISVFYTILITAAQLFGSDFKPLSTWPYIYEEFSEGWITTLQGNRIKYDKININISTCRAHYLTNDIIMEADSRSIARINIGEDNYIFASGKLVKVLKDSLKGAVVQSIGIDIEEMSKADIGYGKSSTASTQSLALSAITANMDFSLNKSMSTIAKEKYSGSEVPIDNAIGIYYKGIFVPATRYDISNIPGIDKKAFKKFVKENKIKFSSVEDLVKVVDYLHSL